MLTMPPIRDLRTWVNGFEVQLQDLRAENQRLQHQTPTPIMPDMSLVMGLLGDVSRRQDVSASRVHSTLSSHVTALLCCLLITSFSFCRCLWWLP